MLYINLTVFFYKFVICWFKYSRTLPNGHLNTVDTHDNAQFFHVRNSPKPFQCNLNPILRTPYYLELHTPDLGNLCHSLTYYGKLVTN